MKQYYNALRCAPSWRVTNKTTFEAISGIALPLSAFLTFLILRHSNKYIGSYRYGMSTVELLKSDLLEWALNGQTTNSQ